MPGIRTALAAAAAFGLIATPAAAEAPLAAYGQLPNIEQIAISPNGNLLAVDFVKGEQRTIVVQNLTLQKIVGGVKLGGKVRGIQWAGDTHLIITSSTYQTGILGLFGGQGEWMTAADFNVAANKMTPLLGDADMVGNMIYGEPEVRTIDGKPTVFVTGVHMVDSVGEATLFKVDLDIDRSSIVIDGQPDVGNFVVGDDGKPLAEVQYDALSKQWALKLWANGTWRQAQTRTVAIDTPDVGGLGRDPKTVLLGESVDGGDYTLREISPDGVLSDPLPGPAVGDEVYDPATHRLIGMATLDGDDLTYHFYDPQDQVRWDAVEAAFPNMGIALASWSADRKKIVLHVNSPTDGPGYALVDLTTGGSAWLGSDYLGLTSADISEVKSISYAAADGLQLSGYLTLPKGRDPKNLPLVVFPHGGPALRDDGGFDWWAQAMASRGYAVLQVNYRGSDGFGWKFLSAGFGEWGGKMQTDLSDGVRYLAGQGTIDPKRVCIVGASYGGYAALAGATLDAGVYRCAVDVEGLSELGKFVAWSNSEHGIDVQRYWDRFMGAKNPSDPHLVAISPADQVAKVAIPILIIHGKDDSVVPFEQSQIMADALRKAGKQVDLVVLNHEDHWLSSSDTRLQMLQATMDFLAKNNPAS